MQIHELKSPPGSRKRKKIVGRGPGSGHGKTSGRGQTGQNSRSGRGIIMGLEGGQIPLIRRLPKVGFRSKRPILYQHIPLSSLTRFKAGAVIDVKALKEKGLIKSVLRPYKILGDGEIKHPLTIQAYAFSKSAEEKITKVGGKVETIDLAAIRKVLATAKES